MVYAMISIGVLGFLVWASFNVDFLQILFSKVGFFLGGRALTYGLVKLGLTGKLAFFISCLVKGFLTVEGAVGNFMMPDAVEPSAVGDQGCSNPGRGGDLADAVRPFLRGEASSSLPEVVESFSPNLVWSALDQPLLEESERHLQLGSKLLIYQYYNSILFGQNAMRFESKLNFLVYFETCFEKNLRMEGFSPEIINNRRDQIRDMILFSYRNNKPLPNSIMNIYLKEMETDFRGSTPFLKIRDLFEA